MHLAHADWLLITWLWKPSMIMTELLQVWGELEFEGLSCMSLGSTWQDFIGQLVASWSAPIGQSAMLIAVNSEENQVFKRTLFRRALRRLYLKKTKKK